jgi:hypothetical protein
VSLKELIVVYLLVGAACAVLVLRRQEGKLTKVASPALTLFLWPLWAPFALGKPTPRHASDPRDIDAVARIERALGEAVDAAADTPLGSVFTRPLASRMLAEVARVATRIGEMRALGLRGGFDVLASAARLRDLEARAAPGRSLATARLQHESLVRLDRLLAGDVQALDDLADLLEALRAQLLLARYAGSSAESAEAIVSEVWARLEGLGAVMDVGQTPIELATRST